MEKKASIVDLVHQTLSNYLDGVPMRPSHGGPYGGPYGNLQELAAHPPGPYIERSIDYTNKYGLGYLCSNGNVGAYFNDSTSIILNPSSRYVYVALIWFMG